MSARIVTRASRWTEAPCSRISGVAVARRTSALRRIGPSSTQCCWGWCSGTLINRLEADLEGAVGELGAGRALAGEGRGQDDRSLLEPDRDDQLGTHLAQGQVAAF